MLNGEQPARPALPRFWLEDGDLVLVVAECGFRVHQRILDPESESQALSRWRISSDGFQFTPVNHYPNLNDVICIQVPKTTGLQVEDVEALLDHLYGEALISVDSPFPRVAAVLHASSPHQLDLPKAHMISRELIERMFPSGPKPFVHPDYLCEALALSFRYQIPSIQKGLYYSLVTTANFDTTGDTTETSVPLSNEPQEAETVIPSPTHLSATDAQRCTRLMHHLIDHFTPTLFTLATGAHMACTNVFADRWNGLVVQPAIENGGVYKPLETLQRIIDIDWASEGLCDACGQEKRAEWQEEQCTIWSKVGDWLDLPHNTNGASA